MNSDYQLIAKAITFLETQLDKQPDSKPTTEEIAAHLEMTSFQFRRVYTRWINLTPKRNLQIISKERGVQLLAEAPSLPIIEKQEGIIGGMQTFNHNVVIESWLPSSYKHGPGYDITIDYSVHDSPFGKMFVAETPRGICKVSFANGRPLLAFVIELHRLWPVATIRQKESETRAVFASIFSRDKPIRKPLSLHLCEVPPRVRIWRALLETAPGSLVHPQLLADAAKRRRGSLAARKALATNPIAFFIPCHRGIDADGHVGNYRWGTTRKHAIHAWESAGLV